MFVSEKALEKARARFLRSYHHRPSFGFTRPTMNELIVEESDAEFLAGCEIQGFSSLPVVAESDTRAASRVRGVAW